MIFGHAMGLHITMWLGIINTYRACMQVSWEHPDGECMFGTDYIGHYGKYCYKLFVYKSR